MKKTLLILFLSFLSAQGFAKVGDVYYCEMTQAIELKEGKLINYIPQKFKFTIDSDNMIRFGLDPNYFRGSTFEVIEFSNNENNSMVIILSILMVIFISPKYLDGP